MEDFRLFYEKQLPAPVPHNCELPEFWAVTKLDELAHKDCDTAWLLILELLDQQLPDSAISCLAAGPLEDLIEYHGPEIIERIEDEARRSPKFRDLLGGVWEASTPEIWSRVLRVRGEPW